MLKTYETRRLARYLHTVVNDFEEDLDAVRFLRRVHIKEVHLQRRRTGRAGRAMETIGRLF